MKKIILIFITIFLLTACNKLTDQEIKYKDYVNHLENEVRTTETLPFDIELILDKIVDREVMYRVIIDKPKEPLKNIEAIVIHNKKTKDIFPSTGIFEEKLNLIPDVINKDSNYVKGIILTGYIPFDEELSKFHANFKVMFKYQDNNEKYHKVIYSTKR